MRLFDLHSSVSLTMAMQDIRAPALWECQTRAVQYSLHSYSFVRFGVDPANANVEIVPADNNPTTPIN